MNVLEGQLQDVVVGGDGVDLSGAFVVEQVTRCGGMVAAAGATDQLRHELVGWFEVHRFRLPLLASGGDAGCRADGIDPEVVGSDQINTAER